MFAAGATRAIELIKHLQVSGVLTRSKILLAGLEQRLMANCVRFHQVGSLGKRTHCGVVIKLPPQLQCLEMQLAQFMCDRRGRPFEKDELSTNFQEHYPNREATWIQLNKYGLVSDRTRTTKRLIVDAAPPNKGDDANAGEESKLPN